MLVVLTLLATPCVAETAAASTRFGFNLKQASAAPWDSTATRRTMTELAALGVDEVSLVVFLWQASPGDVNVVLGSDAKLPAVAQAIRAARAAGLRVVVKPHVWIPGHWAGEVRPANESDMALWFANYERILLEIADVAEREGATRLVVATELRALVDRPEWPGFAARAAERFHGEIEWVADGLETAERFRHWNQFVSISLSLYPAQEKNEDSWRPALERARARLDELSQRWQRPVRIAEIGVRSVDLALLAPWESPEQRRAPVNLAVQSRAYGDVLDVFSGEVASLNFWCWYTDPSLGGRRDSDFTPRGKPAANVLKKRLRAPPRRPGA